jgi:hypothetical protein
VNPAHRPRITFSTRHHISQKGHHLIMNSTFDLAVVAAALHHVFSTSPFGPDSLDVWLAVATEAHWHLFTPAEPPQPLPVFVNYRMQRTEGRYDPATGDVEITTGVLTGTRYTSPASAADAIAAAYPGTGHTIGPAAALPAWRLHHPGHTPDPRTPAHPAVAC